MKFKDYKKTLTKEYIDKNRMEKIVKLTTPEDIKHIFLGDIVTLQDRINKEVERLKGEKFKNDSIISITVDGYPCDDDYEMCLNISFKALEDDNDVAFRLWKDTLQKQKREKEKEDREEKKRREITKLEKKLAKLKEEVK